MRRSQVKENTIRGEGRSGRIGQEERKRGEETTREREDMKSRGGEEVLGE